MWGQIEGENPILIGNERYLRIFAADGQTNFTISPVPENPADAKFFVNGAKQMFNIDFTLDGLGRFQWISPSLKLRATHYLELYYQ